MRLTLRTLLAWMDGVLPTGLEQEMTAKVSATPLAQGLADRIRDVMARPMLPAPAVDGRGFAADPNSAAEYLDNVLHGERLGDFERICIESDMQLAEVGGCHRLLAELAREPALATSISPAFRHRLVEAARNPAAVQPPLGKAEETETVPGSWPTPKGVRRGPRPAAYPSPMQADGRAPLSAWLMAIAAVVLLGILVGFLGWSLTRKAARNQPAVAAAAPTVKPVLREPAPPAERKPPEPAPRPDTPPARSSDKTPDATPTPRPDATPDKAPVPNAVSRLAPAAVVPAPAATEPPAAPAAEAAAPVNAAAPAQQPAPPPQPPPQPAQPPAAAAARVPQGEALAIAAPVGTPAGAAVPPAGMQPTQPAAAVVKPGGEPPADKPTVDESAATVIGEDVLLARVNTPEGGRWESVRAESRLSLPADLLAPAAGRPEIRVDRMRIVLLPQTRVVLERDADGLARLEVVFGRAIVAGDRVNLRIGLVAGGLAGVAAGGSAERLGVEAELVRVPGAEPGANGDRVARLVIAGDGIEWLQTEADGEPRSQPLTGIEPRGRVPGGSALEWRTADPAAVVVRPLDAAPAWLAFGAAGERPGAGTADERTARSAALALAAALPAGTEPVEPLARMAGGRRVEDRSVAIATLALLGDYDELVRSLCAEQPPQVLSAGQWNQLAARTIPLALARGATAATKLAEAFAKHAPQGTADTLVRLARGYGDDELAAGAAAELVAALESPHLVVRRFAIKNLLEITGADGNARIAYRAERSADLRKEGVDWWRGQLEQGGIRRRSGAAAATPRAAP